jgi:hypothetical protein
MRFFASSSLWIIHMGPRHTTSRFVYRLPQSTLDLCLSCSHWLRAGMAERGRRCGLEKGVKAGWLAVEGSHGHCHCGTAHSSFWIDQGSLSLLPMEMEWNGTKAAFAPTNPIHTDMAQLFLSSRETQGHHVSCV